MAAAVLGVSYNNLGKIDQGATYLKRAFDLQDRASGKERLYIAAHYYGEGTRQLGKTIETYEQWKQMYPRDTVAFDNLALLYSSTGDREKALANAQDALQRDPKDAFAYQNLGDTYSTLGRWDEAMAISAQAAAQKLTGPGDAILRFGFSAVRNDAAGMQATEASVRGTPDEPVILLFKAAVECGAGQVQKASQTFAQAVRLTQQLGLKEFSASLRLENTNCQLITGSKPDFRKAVAESLAVSADRDTRAFAASVLAIGGDAARSEKVMADLKRDFSADERLNGLLLPVTRAINEMNANRPAQAIQTWSR